MSSSNGIDRVHRQKLLAFAENLYTLANRHRENHNYVIAHALYGQALVAAEKVATGEDKGHSLVARIREDQQAVFEMLHRGESGLGEAQVEKAQKLGR